MIKSLSLLKVGAGIAVIASLAFLYMSLGAAAFSIIVNLLLGLGMFIGYMYLSFFMVREAIRPRDWLTPLRWRIFAVLSLALLTLVPSITYQVLRLYGIDAPDIRNLVTITSRINGVASLVLLFSIFFYRKKE